MSTDLNIPSDLHQKLMQKACDDLAHGIKAKFVKSESRVNEFSVGLNELHIDLSKTHIDQDLVSLYSAIAESIDFNSSRKDFLAGERINNSEDRSVLHTLLRSVGQLDLELTDKSLEDQAEASFDLFKSQYQSISDSLVQRNVPIKDIIHVGIGGSALGPQLVYEALREINSEITIHFIGNIDGHQMVEALSICDPASTIVIGVSKTFTTAETLQNLSTIQRWFQDAGVDDPLENFIGVTANPQAANSYGLKPSKVVSFPNWVGGRYSVWSAVSLSVALIIGWESFAEFLDGAASVDIHFASQEPVRNLPFLCAALDHYYVNYLNYSSRAIFAYDYRLRSLVAYLQQLETESNGKDRQKDGRVVEQRTAPVIWGGVGTDVQHSVFQMLHQGTSLIHSEFILVKTPAHQYDKHHNELLANGIAQSAALLEGQDRATVERLHQSEELSELAILAKQFSGERPSTTYLLDKLNPRNLGALLAFYEHRTYCFGLLCNINSFDQMGVELGKRLAKKISPLIRQSALFKEANEVEGLDPSTVDLLKKLI